MQPTPVSLPEKSHGQRSLVGCSPWGRKESGTTEWLTLNTKGLWIGPNRKPILPFGAQYPTLQYIHELAHWNPDKMVLWDKQYFSKLSFIVAQEVYLDVPLVQNITRRSHYTVLKEIFQYLQVPLKFGRLISYKCLPFKVINTFLLWFVCFHTGLRHSHA